MALTRTAITRTAHDASSSIDPLPQLRRLISELLPHRGLPLVDRVRRWSDRLLVLVALLTHFAPGDGLVQRFALARACAVEMYPTRKRPGAGYNGFVDRLARHNRRLLDALFAPFRKRLIELAGRSYRTFGFVVFGVDGTKVALPRSDSNARHFGIINKEHAGPEMLLCGLFHVATRSVWAFAHEVARGSERAMFASMLPCLPRDSLVLADAGFIGWNTMTALREAGQRFVIRVGANVSLIRKLCHVETRAGIVHLWPARQQKRNLPPIVLRLVTVVDARRNRRMHLLTDVLDDERLSDEQIVELYAMRWRVEVGYRWLKVSLRGRKLRSGNARHARLEMDWTLMSLWTLTLLGLAAGVPGARLSIAGVLSAVRGAMTRRRSRIRLRGAFYGARSDNYRRRRPKRKRHWPAKARLHRCGMPLARTANAAEIARYRQLFPIAA